MRSGATRTFALGSVVGPGEFCTVPARGEAIHGEVGRRFHGHEEYVPWARQEETFDIWLANREIYRAIRTTRALFPRAKLRFVGDSGLDDQKIFKQVGLVHGQFIFRVCHKRQVEVYNERLDRWELEMLDDLTASVPLPLPLRVAFTHARRVRIVDIRLGWLKIRIPGSQQALWALVAHDPN